MITSIEVFKVYCDNCGIVINSDYLSDSLSINDALYFCEREDFYMSNNIILCKCCKNETKEDRS